MANFSQDFCRFFEELSANNNKEWFDSQKKRFEKSVKAPFYDFVDEMILRIHLDDPDINISAREAVFRIYRDVRFSRDKTPYKTHMSALITVDGRKGMHHPGFYFQMGAENIGIYGGAYSPEKEQLFRLRSYISRHSDEFYRLLNAPEFKNKFGDIQGEKNKRLPAEFQQAAQRVPLLFNKQFYYQAHLDKSHVTDPNLGDLFMEYYFAAKPVKEFLTRAIR